MYLSKECILKNKFNYMNCKVFCLMDFVSEGLD